MHIILYCATSCQWVLQEEFITQYDILQFRQPDGKFGKNSIKALPRESPKNHFPRAFPTGPNRSQNDSQIIPNSSQTLGTFMSEKRPRRIFSCHSSQNSQTFPKDFGNSARRQSYYKSRISSQISHLQHTLSYISPNSLVLAPFFWPRPYRARARDKKFLKKNETKRPLKRTIYIRSRKPALRRDSWL